MRVLFVLGSVVATGLVLAVVVGLFGRVDGTEFHADTFGRRSYVYFRLPLIHVQVTPVWRTSLARPLSRTLSQNGWLKGAPRSNRWDLVACRRNGERWQQGDAWILCQYLDTRDADAEFFWKKWTKNNRAAAAILWPEIAQLARRELYFLVPDLFETAAPATDANQLQRDLNLVLARNYEQLADAEAGLDHFQLAAELYTRALAYEPQRTSSLKGRAAAYQKLGKSDQAEAESDQGMSSGTEHR